MKTYFSEEIEELSDTQAAVELDRALIARAQGLHDFAPRPAFGSDPSQIGWPATLVVELALKLDSPRAICESYGITRQEWEALRVNPAFVADLRRAVAATQGEGGSFKVRSQLQAAELLKTSWQLIHDTAVPAAVRADLIKSTVRWSGLDASRDQGGGADSRTAFQININLA